MFDVPNGARPYNKNGSHPCERYGCKDLVGFDDEPFCFNHSPNSGSSFHGYSYQKNTFNNPTDPEDIEF